MDIIQMNQSHKDDVFKMMQAFYSSPAVYTNGSDDIFLSDIENCINDNPCVEGYVFMVEGNIAGYGMLAKSFSTEFGKMCIWIEDIYVLEDYRNQKIGSTFLNFVQQTYPNAIYRLEVEKNNEVALHVYKKQGFEVLPYMEMKKERK